MKYGVQQKEKKVLSAKGLLAITRKVFSQIPQTRSNPRGKNRKISLSDSLMSALAMFSLKSPSLLAFDQAKIDETLRNNLEKLYEIESVPSDTYMREELDEVDPVGLRKCFTEIFHATQRGKLLDRYNFLDGYLVAIDGTGYFNSEKVNCVNCCEKQRRDGKKEYYHQVLAAAIVHPDHSQVIPLCPELISKQDGATKNDCERRALQRMLALLKKEHPRLGITIGMDGLSANAPVIN